MSEGFGAGKIMPTSIIVVFPWEVYDGENFSASVLDSIDYICNDLRAMGGVRQVYTVTRPQGAPMDYRNLSDLSAGMRAQREGEMLQYVGESNASVLVKVVLQDEPFSQAALGMVPALRARVITLKGEDWNLRNADIYVGGSSATMHDIKSTLDADFVYMAILVIIGIFVILMLVLGSILLPLRAILTIALSISWTLAVTVLLFQNVLGKPVLWLIPIVLFVILMGLGMDYDIFLITRIREEVVAGKTDEEATVIAVERTGGIITACGIIMAGAFGSMMLSGMGMLQQMGFALSFAILLDAMVVRTYLVPSIMVVAKKWNWWAPGRLQRVDEDKIHAAREAERARQQAEAERIKAMGN